jgi:hemoglobin/transferrin/lactoferrin receptor protein
LRPAYSNINGFTLFQAINVDDVKIKDVEGQILWALGDTFNGAQGWQIRTSHRIQESKNKATGNELEPILPKQAVFGFQYQDYSDPWRLQAVTSHSQSAQTVQVTGILFSLLRQVL